MPYPGPWTLSHGCLRPDFRSKTSSGSSAWPSPGSALRSFRLNRAPARQPSFPSAFWTNRGWMDTCSSSSPDGSQPVPRPHEWRHSSVSASVRPSASPPVTSIGSPRGPGSRSSPTAFSPAASRGIPPSEGSPSSSSTSSTNATCRRISAWPSRSMPARASGRSYAFSSCQRPSTRAPSRSSSTMPRLCRAGDGRSPLTSGGCRCDRIPVWNRVSPQQCVIRCSTTKGMSSSSSRASERSEPPSVPSPISRTSTFSPSTEHCQQQNRTGPYARGGVGGSSPRPIWRSRV